MTELDFSKSTQAVATTAMQRHTQLHANDKANQSRKLNKTTFHQQKTASSYKFQSKISSRLEEAYEVIEVTSWTLFSYDFAYLRNPRKKHTIYSKKAIFQHLCC
jgi:hypothetical protein